MKDVFWDSFEGYEYELNKSYESARQVYRTLAFKIGVGDELTEKDRGFLAERLYRVATMDDCADALGLKKDRKRPPMSMDDRNRFLVEMEVLIAVHGLSSEKASEVLAEYHHKDKTKFKKLRTKYPQTTDFVRWSVANGRTLPWSTLPEDLVRLITDLFP